MKRLPLKDNLLAKGSTVIVGVSGGRDSMALVHALLKQRKDLNIVVAHVDHGLRHSSKEDAEFVEGMMLRWEVPFESYSPCKPKTGNLENWGRTKRYEFFEKLLKKHQAQAIATAHHQDDDFESMLLHFFRGTRVKGLSGMLEQREQLVRPLLYTPRSDINAYIEHHEIPFKEDPTNADEKLTRNFLRHKITPVLEHLYPGLTTRWQSQKEYWLELQNMLESGAQLFLDEFLNKEGLNRKAYRELPFPLRATVLELWYKQSTNKWVPDATTIERWDTAIRSWHSGKKTEWDEKRFLLMKKEYAYIK